MKIENGLRFGDFAAIMLKDKEAVRCFKNDMTHKASQAISDAVESYTTASEKFTELKPKAESVAIKITIEFGDADEIEYEEDD